MPEHGSAAERMPQAVEGPAQGASSRGSLREESRDRARARIIRGAMAAIATSGLDVTVDDVAEMAGVSRRTVFRQFRTHGELVAAAVTQMLADLVARVPGPPGAGDDVEAWIISSSVTIHVALREIVGRAFWDVHIERAGTPGEVSVALRDIASLRGRIMTDLATAAWCALDAPDTPPEWVIEAFTMQLSGFATNLLVSRSAEAAGQICGRILWATLCEAVRGAREGR